jgi:hypothetical protein
MSTVSRGTDGCFTAAATTRFQYGITKESSALWVLCRIPSTVTASSFTLNTHQWQATLLTCDPSTLSKINRNQDTRPPQSRSSMERASYYLSARLCALRKQGVSHSCTTVKRVFHHHPLYGMRTVYSQPLQ